MYILSQTFFIDPNSVGAVSTVYLTSIDLYVNVKPSATNNKSGIVNPSLRLSISDTRSDNSPNYTSAFPQSIVSVPYSSVISDTTATTPTKFTFSQPVPINTGVYYSINVKADDPDYTLWYAKTGDAVVGTTNTPFPGFGGTNAGSLFDYATSGTMTPIQNSQLKYTLRVAQFTSNSASFEIVNNGYEFFIVSNQKGNGFIGGETVFPLLSNVATQTAIITANSNVILGNNTPGSCTHFTTQFTPNSSIVLYTSASNLIVRTVNSVSNDTYMTVTEPIPYTNGAVNYYVAPVGKVYHADAAANLLFLTNSTANSGLAFSNSVGFTGSSAATLTNGSNTVSGLTSTTNLFVGMPVSSSNALCLSTTGTMTYGSNLITGLASVVGTQVGQLVYVGNVGMGGGTIVTNVVGSPTNSIQMSSSFFGPSATNYVVNTYAMITPGTTITQIGTTSVNLSTQYVGTTTTTANVYFQTPIVGGTSGTNAYIASITSMPITQFEPEIGINLPKGGNAVISYNFATANTTQFYMAGGSNPATASFTNVVNNTKTTIQNYTAMIASRSIEVSAAAGLYGTFYGSNTKSGVIKVNLTQETNSSTSNTFTSPFIFGEKIDIFSSSTIINNDANNEVYSYGAAAAKHITTKIAFDPTYSAQDLLVQATAYLPLGTQLLAYAKLYNSKDSDSFSSKLWTPLYPAANSTAQVSTPQSNNYVQLSWGLPNAPPTLYTANGTVSVGTAPGTTQVSGANVYGAGTNFGNEILVNDVVKLWNPSIPGNYQVAVVKSVTNTTFLTLNTTISNSSVYGIAGLQIDKIQNPYIGFTNPQNYNIVRYYNSTLTEFDTYDTLQIKIVFLSNNAALTPRVSSLTAVGLSS